MKKIISAVLLSLTFVSAQAVQINEFSTYVSNTNQVVLKGKVLENDRWVPIKLDIGNCLFTETRIDSLCKMYEVQISPVKWASGEDRTLVVKAVVGCLGALNKDKPVACVILKERF